MPQLFVFLGCGRCGAGVYCGCSCPGVSLGGQVRTPVVWEQKGKKKETSCCASHLLRTGEDRRTTERRDKPTCQPLWGRGDEGAAVRLRLGWDVIFEIKKESGQSTPYLAYQTNSCVKDGAVCSLPGSRHLSPLFCSRDNFHVPCLAPSLTLADPITSRFAYLPDLLHGPPM